VHSIRAIAAGAGCACLMGLTMFAVHARAGEKADPRAPAQADAFPGGLSPQWLNAANVDRLACLARLDASGAKYRTLPPQPKPDRHGCGMPNGVIVFRGPTGIVYNPPLTVDCSFAQDVPAMEAVFQEEATDKLGDRIARIDTLGAYACVTKAGPYTTRYATKPAISEHSFGLAYDLRSFATVKGRTITVERDYEKGTVDPQKPAGRFLRAVAVRLRSETSLTHVLTPDFNADHYNHFHLDRGLAFGWWWSTNS
jgi:hypothetical protein